ncbi:MAG: hypothetical protein ACD_62C00575G0002 [uncultured bacterium]|nr:MAG: hypothetical protein ACD_62C00575G0002 [uncultured bacterium]HLD44219.1 Maf family protein [bacterium]
MQLILASKSPRRHQLFKQLLIDINAATKNFNIIIPDIDESCLASESPLTCAKRLALEKARSIITESDALILTADTIVVLDKQIYGKPLDEEDAIRMLGDLCGRTHEVITGYCLLITEDGKEKQIINDHDSSLVTFRTYSLDEIKKFVATGIPLDKAGAYAVQEDMFGFIQKIEGSYTNVMGLPVEKIAKDMSELLRRPTI